MSKKIILVDDDADDRELFQTFLEDRDDIHMLPSQRSGTELIDFLTKVNSDDELPNLIILDQNMPKMNGKQTLAFLKSHARFVNIPTVIYSTYTDAALIADCKKLGAELVATKPIDRVGYRKMMDQFMEIVNKPG